MAHRNQYKPLPRTLLSPSILTDTKDGGERLIADPRCDIPPACSLFPKRSPLLQTTLEIKPVLASIRREAITPLAGFFGGPRQKTLRGVGRYVLRLRIIMGRLILILVIFIKNSAPRWY